MSIHYDIHYDTQIGLEKLELWLHITRQTQLLGMLLNISGSISLKYEQDKSELIGLTNANIANSMNDSRLNDLIVLAIKCSFANNHKV
jgi:hypothetical protein